MMNNLQGSSNLLLANLCEILRSVFFIYKWAPSISQAGPEKEFTQDVR